MRAINKGPEPAPLQRYRAVPGVTYDGKDFTPIKDAIRTALLGDQLWLCCYCLRRIRWKKAEDGVPPVIEMKVEHWQSQEHHPELQLAWTNMLGACLGGEGSPRADHTCDTRKGDQVLALNPLDHAHVSTLQCTSTGRLESTDPRFQGDIDERLGLNHPILTSERKRILHRSTQQLRVRYPRSTFPVSAVRALIEEQESPAEGRLPALCSVLRLWARKRFGGHW